MRSPSYLLLIRKEMCEILCKTQGGGRRGEEFKKDILNCTFFRSTPSFVPSLCPHDDMMISHLMGEVEFNTLASMNFGKLKFYIKRSAKRPGKCKSTVISLAAFIWFPCYRLTWLLLCSIFSFGKQNLQPRMQSICQIDVQDSRFSLMSFSKKFILFL